jgi:hypothetical protein
MATITTIAHTDRPIQHRFVALFIGLILYGYQDRVET